MGHVKGIFLQPRILVTVSAVADIRHRHPHTPVLEMAGNAVLGVQRVAGFLEARLVEAEYGVPFLREVVATETFAVSGRLQAKIGSTVTQTKQMADIGLQLLTQASRCRAVAVLAGEIRVATDQWPAHVPGFLPGQQQQKERQRTG